MTRELAEILKWYGELGVDVAVTETPGGWFDLTATPLPPSSAAPTSRAPARQMPTPALARQPMTARPAPVAPDAAVMDARERARQAATLRELRQVVETFEACPLKRTAKNLCFADGQNTAELMLIGEAPGRDEDLEGRPFVGKAGQLLDKMLSAIGCTRDTNSYITNTVFWRPPGNRTPTPAEIQMCLPFVERQIALVRPKVLVLLGGAAAKNLLGINQGITRLRGKWRNYRPSDAHSNAENSTSDGVPLPVIATLHPAYLLRNPSSKRLAWQDLLQIRARLDTPN